MVLTLNFWIKFKFQQQLWWNSDF